MNRTLYRTLGAVAAAGILTSAATGVAAASAIGAHPTDDDWLPIHTATVVSTVHLAGNLSTSTTSGTFAAAGSLTDAGTESGSGYFEGGTATSTGPNILHATQTFTGARGSLTVALTGEFGPLPAQTAAAKGYWTVTSGTGSYAHLHALGHWNAVADFTAALAHTGAPTVTFMLEGLTS